MMQRTDTLRAAAHRLAKTFGDRPAWLNSVGVSSHGAQKAIFVYLAQQEHPTIPKTWEGHPVVVKFMGYRHL